MHLSSVMSLFWSLHLNKTFHDSVLTKATRIWCYHPSLLSQLSAPRSACARLQKASVLCFQHLNSLHLFHLPAMVGFGVVVVVVVVVVTVVGTAVVPATEKQYSAHKQFNKIRHIINLAFLTMTTKRCVLTYKYPTQFRNFRDLQGNHLFHLL